MSSAFVLFLLAGSYTALNICQTNKPNPKPPPPKTTTNNRQKQNNHTCIMYMYTYRYVYKIMWVIYSVCVCLQFGLQTVSLARLFSISTCDEKQNKNDFLNVSE